jgi:hypothetical protein
MRSISIEAERNAGKPPSNPTFLSSLGVSHITPAEWHGIVLPYMRTVTFVMSSTGDVDHMRNILRQWQYPDLWRAMTKVSFPGFRWCDELAKKRRSSPYFAFMASLPALREITLRLTTAISVRSRWSELRQVNLEATDLALALERKTKALQEIIQGFELDSVFVCANLRLIRLEYMLCELTQYHTTVGDEMQMLRDIQIYLVNGFNPRGMNVRVELVEVPAS